MLVEAVEAAEADLSSQQMRAKTEEGKMAKDQLIEVHSTVREMIKDETSELEMIRQQCDRDLQTIGEKERFSSQIVWLARSFYPSPGYHFELL